MNYFERIGEECGFGTSLVDGGFLWFDGDCEAMLARVRRDALEEAAAHLTMLAENEWRGAQERHAILCCATWVLDLTRAVE